MSSNLRIAVLFGGNSSEYSISLLSASSVIQNLNEDKYDLLPVGITRDGRWYHYTGPVSAIADGTWTTHNNNPCTLSPDSSVKSLLVFDNDRVKYFPIDVVFPVLHGKNGEDGTIQGLLALSGIPYVGCDMTASANCMDKGLTNTLLEAGGIPQAKFVAFTVDQTADAIAEIEQKLGYPVFVKPAGAGSSIGISKARNHDELVESIRLASPHDRKIVVEENIEGREVECAVMGSLDPEASVVGEIETCNEFYDYEAKYHKESKLYIPAQIDETIAGEIRKQAIKAYKLLGCHGMAQVGFFVRKSDNAILLNEINTIPDFKNTGMFSKMFAASGLPYPALLDKLIALAGDRV